MKLNVQVPELIVNAVSKAEWERAMRLEDVSGRWTRGQAAEIF